MKGIRTKKVLLIAALLLAVPASAMAEPNFRVVNLPPEQGAVYERAAEDEYVQLSRWWFGKPHPDLWRPTAGPGRDVAPVPIAIHLEAGAGGGRTTFRIDRGHVFGWKMTVAGSPRKIIDDVIPHEVGHVVLYARFRRPLGRCLDEGAAAVGESRREHAASRERVAAALRDHAELPFSRIVDEHRYPSPATTPLLYAQSHSLVEFLLQRKRREAFVAFLDDPRAPSAKLRDFYGWSVDELQTEWETWFRQRAARGSSCTAFGCPFHVRAKPQAVAVAPSTPKPVVYAFTAKWCAACAPFKRDVAEGRFPAYRFVFVDPDADKRQWKDVTAKMAAETGHRGGVPLPSWWVPGSKRLLVMRNGYSAPGLLQVLGKLIRGLVRILYNPDLEPDGTSPQGTRPQGEGAPVPSGASETDDWSGVTIILLVAEQDAGDVRGKARRALIGLSRGPLERKAGELTGGKAALRIVAERTEPNRYRAVLSAAGLEPTAFDVLVLVPRRNVGLVKGAIVKRIEAIAEGKLRGRPSIDVLFERAHPADFAAVRDALRAADDPQPLIPPATTAAIESLTRKDLKTELLAFGKQFVRKEVEAAVVAKISGGEPPDPLRDLKQDIVFWLASIGLPLWLVERITKNRRLERQVQKAWLRLRSFSPPSPPSPASADAPGSSSGPSPASGSDSTSSV
jgi:hypothetical protein